ncbi:hypothetical protein SDC9_212984 [bioreactor metagenome]|uniref:Uncharacterized protein n=1 Tax=bioreactor metagenome TaxID=1076179 RepID=A0A645JNH0_9ZZZZ
MALGLDPGDEQTMLRKPRHPKDGVFAGGLGSRPLRPGHRRRQVVCGDSLADGHRRQAAAPAAERALRPPVYQRAAQAARTGAVAPIFLNAGVRSAAGFR